MADAIDNYKRAALELALEQLKNYLVGDTRADADLLFAIRKVEAALSPPSPTDEGK